jgi:hypothetical protein
MAHELEVRVTAPPSREAEIAARLDTPFALVTIPADDVRYLLAHLQQARQERDAFFKIAIEFMSNYESAKIGDEDLMQSFRLALAEVSIALQQARDALRDYGRHNEGCVHLAMPRATPINELHYPCTCGLDAALKDEGR